MTGADLSDSDNVVRYIRPRLVDNGVVDGSAFTLREGESGLSVHWIESVSNDDTERQVAAVRELIRLTMSRNGVLAELNVGATKLALHERLGYVRFTHKPLDAGEGYVADPSHSEIEGLPLYGSPDAALIGDMIAECITQLHTTV